MTSTDTAKCKHCQQEIRYFSGRLWHDERLPFPQYCQSKYDRNTGEQLPDQLHEPETVETRVAA